MLHDVIQVKALLDHRLWVAFEDGVEGMLDAKDIMSFRGVFSALKNPEEFAKVSVNPELGVVCWGKNADLDSDVLYAKITNQPIRLSHLTAQESTHV